MSIDARQLRNALGQFATGITVVTAYDGGDVHGMTANSFTSVSLDPPLILVCVDRRNRTHEVLPRVERFAINVLSADQESISRYFAGDRSQPPPYRLDQGAGTRSPVFEGVLAWFDCSLWRVYDGGDHSIFVGEVEQFAAVGGRPLLYFQGAYARLP